MALEQLPAIHFTMHPSGVWTVDGDQETYVGPCVTMITTSVAGSDVTERSYLSFRTVSITRPVAPTPETSEEEDPEEGSTPPLSPQLMPACDDIPESSSARMPFVLDQTSSFPRVGQFTSPWLYPESLDTLETARLGVEHIDWVREMRLPQADPMPLDEQTLPLMVLPISAVPSVEASEPVLPLVPEQPFYLTDESEEIELEADEEIPEPVEVHYPVYVPADYPSDEDEDDDDEMEDYGFNDVPGFVDLGDAAEWMIDDEGDFPMDSDDDIVSCVTSESSSSSSDFGPGW